MRRFKGEFDNGVSWDRVPAAPERPEAWHSPETPPMSEENLGTRFLPDAPSYLQARVAFTDEEWRESSKRQREIGAWANKHGVTDSKVLAGIERRMIKGIPLEEAVRQVYSRIESGYRRVLGPELWKDMREEKWENLKRTHGIRGSEEFGSYMCDYCGTGFRERREAMLDRMMTCSRCGQAMREVSMDRIGRITEKVATSRYVKGQWFMYDKYGFESNFQGWKRGPKHVRVEGVKMDSESASYWYELRSYSPYGEEEETYLVSERDIVSNHSYEAESKPVFSNKPNPLSRSRVEELARKHLRWFDKENDMFWATRAHGDVGRETAGREDINAAKEFKKAVLDEFPGHNVVIEAVDEWVSVGVKPAKGTKLAASTRPAPVMRKGEKYWVEHFEFDGPVPVLVKKQVWSATQNSSGKLEGGYWLVSLTLLDERTGEEVDGGIFPKRGRRWWGENEFKSVKPFVPRVSPSREPKVDLKDVLEFMNRWSHGSWFRFRIRGDAVEGVTREHGNYGGDERESAGERDIEEADRLVKLVKDKFGDDVEAEEYHVDEWTGVRVTAK